MAALRPNARIGAALGALLGTGTAAGDLSQEPPQPVARSAMARCETCGNDYDKAFQVNINGATHTFDSFECAIHALAPICENWRERPFWGRS